MRIAVPYENNDQIFQHFGHTECFKFYDTDGPVICATQYVYTNGSGHSALAGFLKEAQTDALICGGIGGGAKQALEEAGIALYPGVEGSADRAARALAEGRLVYDPEAQCYHHEHEHGEGCADHECGHDCGSCHSC